jgi:uncharacterized protein (DUF4415 family)
MPKLTAKRRAGLIKLAKLPNSKIDLSDIPEIRGVPSDAVIGKFYRPRKKSITIRIDADALSWLKGSGEGYQTRINTFLRRLMQSQVRGRG